MRALIVLVLLAHAASAAPGVVGCWDVQRGARTVFRVARGGQLRARSTFAERPRGGPEAWDEDAVRVRGTGEVEWSCRPQSQHGAFCRAKREGAGLRVRVFALHHGDRVHGRLVEDFVAERCAADK